MARLHNKREREITNREWKEMPSHKKTGTKKEKEGEHDTDERLENESDAEQA